MSTGPSASDPTGGPAGVDQMTEQELRAAYEAEIKRIRVEQVLFENVVSLINLGMRRTGLQPGTEDERDLDQVRLAIDSIRALMPLIEQTAGPQIGAIRDALSQLQMAFVRLGGAPAPAAAAAAAVPGDGGGGERGAGADPGGSGGSGGPESPEQPPPKPGEAGPAQRSGRLWVPGQ